MPPHLALHDTPACDKLFLEGLVNWSLTGTTTAVPKQRDAYGVQLLLWGLAGGELEETVRPHNGLDGLDRACPLLRCVRRTDDKSCFEEVGTETEEACRAMWDRHSSFDANNAFEKHDARPRKRSAVAETKQSERPAQHGQHEKRAKNERLIERSSDRANSTPPRHNCT